MGCKEGGECASCWGGAGLRAAHDGEDDMKGMWIAFKLCEVKVAGMCR